MTDEDAQLWARVAETARPLHKGRDRVAAGRVAEPDTRADPVAPRPARPAKSAAATRRRPQVREPERALPEPADIERRERRLLASGRRAVDARLDLHGLRQAEAHRKLGSFLRRAQLRGHRHVLVITGKGGSERDRDSASFFEPPDRGVLKRLVPQWLADAELRRIVVGFGEAHARHGGEGALYVRLRRLERPRLRR